ncbi:MAG: hypothetical protein WC593_10980 [Methanoregula sp.]
MYILIQIAGGIVHNLVTTLTQSCKLLRFYSAGVIESKAYVCAYELSDLTDQLTRKNIAEKFLTSGYQKFMKGCENLWEKAVDAIGILIDEPATITGLIQRTRTMMLTIRCWIFTKTSWNPVMNDMTGMTTMKTMIEKIR